MECQFGLGQWTISRVDNRANVDDKALGLAFWIRDSVGLDESCIWRNSRDHNDQKAIGL